MRLFGSLRSKLIASYVAVIFLCLFLAGSAVVIALQDYQERIRLDQLADLSQTVSGAVLMMEARGEPMERIIQLLRAQSEALRVRIILTDRSGQVVEDTSGEFEGTRISLPSSEGVERRPNSSRAYYASTEYGLFMIAPSQRRILGPMPEFQVILAVPQASIAQAWWELAPMLSVAGAVSLVVSILVALVMTRSISRPLLMMTRASEEMARGHYKQSIAASGSDEVGRLARAFNEMAHQVSTSDRTMRDFLANVSHELKTPLTSIQGFSEAILDGTVDDEDQRRHAASIISQEAKAMRRLVEDLLTLSKIESGQIAMDEEAIEVDRLLREVVRRVEWQLEGSAVEVSVEAQTGATVLGDAHWLEQVFANLFDNALKHAPARGRIGVRAAIRQQPAEVVVSFHNTGSHIPSEDLPRVFERFFQVDRSRSPRNGGSGLGLAIVREVVQAHGGSVEAESAPTAGTTFRVRLPLHALAPPRLYPVSRVA